MSPFQITRTLPGVATDAAPRAAVRRVIVAAGVACSADEVRLPPSTDMASTEERHS